AQLVGSRELFSVPAVTERPVATRRGRLRLRRVGGVSLGREALAAIPRVWRRWHLVYRKDASAHPVEVRVCEDVTDVWKLERPPVRREVPPHADDERVSGERGEFSFRSCVVRLTEGDPLGSVHQASLCVLVYAAPVDLLRVVRVK